MKILYANIGKEINVNGLLRKTLEIPENKKISGLKNKNYYLSVKDFLIENNVLKSTEKGQNRI